MKRRDFIAKAGLSAASVILSQQTVEAQVSQGLTVQGLANIIELAEAELRHFEVAGLDNCETEEGSAVDRKFSDYLRQQGMPLSLTKPAELNYIRMVRNYIQKKLNLWELHGVRYDYLARGSDPPLPIKIYLPSEVFEDISNFDHVVCSTWHLTRQTRLYSSEDIPVLVKTNMKMKDIPDKRVKQVLDAVQQWLPEVSLLREEGETIPIYSKFLQIKPTGEGNNLYFIIPNHYSSI